MTTDNWSEDPAQSANGQTSKSSLMEIGMAQTQGYRSNIEDFYGARDVQTKGGLTLLLAIVADGIGGNNHGEVAAEMTVNLVFEYVENSAEANPENIPQLLKGALEYANDKVFTRARTEKEKSGMGTTAAVAAICEKQFYFANVGDSRIYLFRQGIDKATKEKRVNLHPVTLDHTWGHEMIVQGKLEADKALTHPKAGELTRSIGYESTLEVDLSFYPNGLETKAAIRKTQGLKLGSNDRIVICSDGLIKERHDDKSQVYTTEAEIIQALTTKKPQQAAEALIKQVDERKVDDNASVIVLEVPGSARVPVWQQYLPYIAGGLLALLLLGGGIGYAATRPDPTPTPTVVVAVVEEPTAESETAVADTSSGTEAMTPTQAPTLAPVEAEVIEFAASVYSSSNNYERLSNTELTITQGDLVVEGLGTSVTIQNRFGANVQLAPEGLVGIRYDTGNQRFEVHCLRGTCAVKGDVGGEAQLSAGQAVTVGSTGTPGTLFPAQSELFTFAAVVPTPTALPTATSTPTPTATFTATPRPTPTLAPTLTPSPVPATAIPPRSTEVPPTEVTPTEVTPTEVPPTEVPPTEVPPGP